MKFRVTVRTPGADRDLEIEASEAARMGDLVQALPLDAGPVLIDGRPTDLDASVGASSIREGSVVSSATDAPASDRVSTRFALAVVGGPDAGRAFPLTNGTHSVGRAEDASIHISDEDVSRLHLELAVTDQGVSVRDLGSTNGTAVNGQHLGQDFVYLLPEDLIGLGATSLRVKDQQARRAQLLPDGRAGVILNRSPRILAVFDPPEVELPPPLRSLRKRPFPWIAAVAPVVVAVGMAVLLRQPQFLLFAILSPITTIGTQWAERRHDRNELASEKADFEQRNARALELLGAAIKDERQYLESVWPDPAAVVAACTEPSLRLWERRPSDRDYLNLRIGLCSRPVSVRMRQNGGAAQAEPPLLTDIPCGVSLRHAGVVGLAAPDPQRTRAANAIVAQIIGLHAADDVRLCVLAPDSGWQKWAWLRWAPHLRDTRNPSVIWAGFDSAGIGAQVQALHALLELRRDRARDGRDVRFSPDYVLVLDGSSQLRQTSEIAALLEQGPQVGIYSLCLDSDDRLLPEECRAVVSLSGGDLQLASLDQPDGTQQRGVLMDQLASETAGMAARALAPIRRVAGQSSGGEIPDSVRLLDLVTAGGLDIDDITSRWAVSHGSTRVVVGASSDGPTYIDIASDGPHALVAGTSGSGKSEFLQTWIASLALANRPDEFTFVFVDYKGGAAFAELAALPHTVGMVTGGDQRITERALTSLDAELQRRQTLLAQHGAADLPAYVRLRASNPLLAAVPRLAIVIDEFAEMKEELPDFVDGLARVARVGRSLGIHLVLATQRPAGVVSPEIRSNSNLRVCLRVADESDSLDIVDATDAAAISKTTPGRAILRVGTEGLRRFQSARVAGSQPAPVASGQMAARWLEPDDWLSSQDKPQTPETTTTDLQVLVAAISAAASRAQIPMPSRPWAAPLPAAVQLSALSPSQDRASITLGMLDLPAQQLTSTWGPAVGENLLVVGSPRSGRTTLLRTLAVSAATTYTVEDLHIYVWDGGGSLASLTSLPNVGTIVTRSQIDRAQRLLLRLEQQIMQRNRELNAAGFSSVSEQRASVPEVERIPWSMLLVDRWESLADESTRLGLDDRLLRIMSEGPAAGLFVVLCGDHTVARSKFLSTAARTILLPLNDPGAALAIGLPSRTDLSGQTPGRAVLAPEALDLQIAVLADGTGTSETLAVQQAAAGMPKGAAGATPPMRIAELPIEIRITEIEPVDTASGGVANGFLIGVGGDEAAPVYLPRPGGLIVAGPSRSGRSTTLLTVAAAARDAGLRVAAASPRPGPLEQLRGQSGATWLETATQAATPWSQILNDHDVVVIDGLEVLGNDFELAAAVQGVSPATFVASVDIDACGGPTPVIKAALKQATSMLLLSPPDHFAAAYVGIMLARGAGFNGPPGRGIFRCEGEQIPVQVALT